MSIAAAHENLVELRQKCRESWDLLIESGFDPAANPRLVIHTVAAIGAIYESQYSGAAAGKLPSEREIEWLNNVITPLLEAGYPVNPDFEIDVVNFMYGEDFMMDQKPYDLAVFCNVPKLMDEYIGAWPDERLHENARGNLAEYQSQQPSAALYLRSSALAFSPNCLTERAARGGIKIYGATGFDQMRLEPYLEGREGWVSHVQTNRTQIFVNETYHAALAPQRKMPMGGEKGYVVT